MLPPTGPLTPVADRLLGSRPPYQYLPLNSWEKDGIRLLFLKPAAYREEPLKCYLFHGSIKDRSYKALSYTWGDQTEQLPLAVLQTGTFVRHGVDVIMDTTEVSIINITRNLHTALLCLRDSNAVSGLWIDAVCIDQANQDEKQRQIRLMSIIYQNATKTIIWLGEADANTKRLFSFLRFIGHSKRGGDHWRQLREVLRRTGMTKAMWESAYELCRRPWFNRVWTAQELCLSREAQIVCGAYSLQWDHMENLNLALPFPAFVFSPRKPYGGYDIAKSYSSPTRLSKYTYFDHMNKIEADRRQYIFEADRRRYIFGLMVDLSTAQATDPKDKVFGVIALAEELGASVPPLEYTMSIEEIYATATRFWLLLHSRLSTLLLAAAPSPVSDLPSWAIDWNRDASRTVFHRAFHLEIGRPPRLPIAASNFHLGIPRSPRDPIAASNGSDLQGVVNEQDWRKMGLRGVMLGQNVVRLVKANRGVPDTGLYTENCEFALRWLHLVLDSEEDGGHGFSDLINVVQFLSDKETVGRWENVWELQAFLRRTAVATRDLITDDNFPTKPMLQTVQDEFNAQRLGHDSRNVAMMERFEQLLRFCATFTDYTLFGTSHKLIGACICNEMKKGDSIALVAGSDFPMVLRETGKEGEYQLVGQAYIEEFMDGRVWIENSNDLIDITLV